MTDMHAACE